MKVEYVWNFPSKIKEFEGGVGGSDSGWIKSNDQNKEIESTSKETDQVS